MPGDNDNPTCPPISSLRSLLDDMDPLEDEIAEAGDQHLDEPQPDILQRTDDTKLGPHPKRLHQENRPTTRYEENLAWLLIGGGLDGMLENENLDSVNTFRCITPKTHRAVASYIGRRINKAFAPWIDSPLEFRQVLRSTHSIVSGSVALNAIMGSSWLCNNLDVYVAAGAAKNTVVEYLQTQESYIVMDESVFPPEPTSTFPWCLRFVTSVTRLEKRTSTLRGEVVRQIDVLQSTGHSTQPVASFSATWSMNWIGADEIIAQYPNMTLAYQGVLNWPCETDTEEDALWLAKYIGFGFRIVDGIANPPCPFGWSCAYHMWPCTAICSMRRTMDTGGDALRALADSYDKKTSPEARWIHLGLKECSDFEYMCDEHDKAGHGPRGDPMMYDHYDVWEEGWIGVDD